MMLRPTEKRALMRMWRAIVLPSVLVMLDMVIKYLEVGQLLIDWKVVGVAGLTALAMGVSKWIRDEIGRDIKVA
jgi:hypothetical protein